ncbi:MAG TPA: ATP-grasp domain-containing protein, partial [Vicinamibacteria bacterium]|nr:ATP-grasp domain-containing protein [Vicinamibacteria bacterium]
VLALMHQSMMPPDDVEGYDLREVSWKMEFDVIETLMRMGHRVSRLGVESDLGVIRRAIRDERPHIVFNLLEDFDDVPIYDQNVVSYLELLRVLYTGCNARGLMLARDKAVSKKLLAYHRIRVPEFNVFQRGRNFRMPPRLRFPAIVKSLVQDASAGISQASVVEDEDRLRERIAFVHKNVGTDAIVERYIDGRELYVGVIGNERLQVFPVWEIYLSKLSKSAWAIATGHVKWNARYQRKHKIRTGPAKNLSDSTQVEIQKLAKRIYRNLYLSGYARIDFRLDPVGRIFFLEANPNPQLAYGEDFAESAEAGGISYEKLLQRILNLGLQWSPH